jgi:hypothetical protein
LADEVERLAQALLSRDLQQGDRIALHMANLPELVVASARFTAAPSGAKVRRFKEVYDGASTWRRVRRIVARVEAGPQGADTRFIVTNLRHGSGRSLYRDLYCQRGQAENHVKAWKAHLAADRTSCTKATANQFRLFLHAGAYWLLWSLRALMPKRSAWRSRSSIRCACGC